MKKHQFKPVSSQVDFPKMERELLSWWYKSGIVKKYLHQNDNSKENFSFIDGPITANNPMGIHHAWGRTYKDLWQRFNSLQGKKQRFQNGFDCQGLWVEVEVEKDLGFKSKKDIEIYGIANFVNKCKDRVLKYSAIQTEQSKRLGYFMDWDHSYFTMSDENNYMIWHFLKVCFERGWVYKGHESIPWCPRCETAISQHEMLTEDYKELVHESIIMEFPLVNHKDEALLVWTTTPWTIIANVAVAVDAKIKYALVEGTSGQKFWLAKDRLEAVFKGNHGQILKEVLGGELVGLKYQSAFDGLPGVEAARKENPALFHSVVATDPLLMPITVVEGTGLVHTAVSAGEEDFKLGKKLGLPMIPVIADDASYLEGFGEFSGKNAKKDPRIILDFLEKNKRENGWVFEIFKYTHRYPACWRCKTELVWKVADEWYIAMDRPSQDASAGKATLREQLVEVTKKIAWLPEFGLDRELDWLKNMHDWLISKKNRYWGLALPIYECQKCNHFEVLGGKDELKSRAVAGWDKFEGNTPHRPWIDEVKIKCSKCGEETARILDVGNPWLDAGIVPFSTLNYLTDKKYWQEWFPADFITESFPGQFKNWFYSLLVMSTVLTKEPPFKTVLGYGSLLAEDGRPMHKSWGNSIEFNEGADKIGGDVMRWMYAKANPAENLLFGYKKADEVRRQFFLTLWNVYSFFVTYAQLDGWTPEEKTNFDSENILDKWVLLRLAEVTDTVTKSLKDFNSQTAAVAIENFVNDLSLWYIRRSRDRVGPTAENGPDKSSFYQTAHFVLVTLTKLLAPITPFISEEMYKNLTGQKSVHLTNWPTHQTTTPEETELIEDMNHIRKLVELGLSLRKEQNIKLRQPRRYAWHREPKKPITNIDLLHLLLMELNVKSKKEGEKFGWIAEDRFNEFSRKPSVVSKESADGYVIWLDTELNEDLLAQGKAAELVRSIQDARKLAGTAMDEKVTVLLPDWPKEFEDYIKKETLSQELRKGDALEILRS